MKQFILSGVVVCMMSSCFGPKIPKSVPDQDKKVSVQDKKVPVQRDEVLLKAKQAPVKRKEVPIKMVNVKKKPVKETKKEPAKETTKKEPVKKTLKLRVTLAEIQCETTSDRDKYADYTVSQYVLYRAKGRNIPAATTNYSKYGVKTFVNSFDPAEGRVPLIWADRQPCEGNQIKRQ